MIKGIVFDMGGTLLRYVRPGAGSWRELEAPGIRGVYRYLVDQGHPIASHEDEFVEAMFARLAEGWEQSTGGHINLRAVDWIASGAADHAITLDEQALREAASLYARPMREGLTAMPGAVEMLAALDQEGYHIGLISNTIWPAELHIEDLAEAGILPYLDHMDFSGELGCWKPNPRIFLHTLSKLEVAPQEAIFIGDNPREDIVGAQGVGMRAVWQRSAEFPLGDVRPDAIVDSLVDLPPILQRWHV